MKSEEVTGLENEVGALGVVPGEDAAGAEDPAGVALRLSRAS